MRLVKAVKKTAKAVTRHETKSKEVKISNLEKRYDTNPFIGAQAQYKRAKKRTVVKGGKAILDTETGEVEDMAEIVTTHEVDGEQFVKLYTSELKQLFSLTASSMRLLQVLLQQVQKSVGNDTILMNVGIMQRYFEALDAKPMSRPTFYRCINEMIEKAFIAPAADSRDLFFINPSLFFNGDRVRLVKEYHINRQTKMFEDGSNAVPKIGPDGGV